MNDRDGIAVVAAGEAWIMGVGVLGTANIGSGAPTGGEVIDVVGVVKVG